MKRCARCVFPETVPQITFDDKGVCNHCRTFQEQSLLGEDALEAIFVPARAQNSQYDCIVPLSGGRDSTYVLYLAKARYNLRPLAVNYDNEFRTAQALANMQSTCQKLDVEFVQVRSRRNLARKIVRNEIRSSIARGPGAVSNAFCSACTYGYRSAALRTAESYHTPLIIWGASQGEQTLTMQAQASPGPTASRYRRLLEPSFFMAQYHKMRLRAELLVPGNKVFSRRPPTLQNKSIQEVYLFDYLQWDRQKIKQAIMTELGWRAPEGSVSTWRIDCHLHKFMNYCFLAQYGCSKDCFGYCNMINAGQMTRAEALRQEEHNVATCWESLPGLLENDVGLSPREVGCLEAFATPPASA